MQPLRRSGLPLKKTFCSLLPPKFFLKGKVCHKNLKLQGKFENTYHN